MKLELTKLFFNNLSVSSNNLASVSDNSLKGGSKFEDYMSGSSKTDKNSIKTDSPKNEKQLKKDKTYKTDKNGKTDKSNKVKTDKKVNEDNSKDKTEGKANVESENKESVSVDKKSAKDCDTQLSSEEKSMVSQKETELKGEVAEILGIEMEDVEKILNNLEMTVFDLKDAENLLDFMQAALEVSEPSELLAVDGIKDMLVDIKQAVEEQTSGFEELLEKFDFNALNDAEEVTPEIKKAVSEEPVVNDSLETEEPVQANSSKQGIVKNENISLREKNNEVSENTEAETAKTEDSQIKISENMNSQNNFSQQGFKDGGNDGNMKSDYNSASNKIDGMNATVFDNINKAFGKVIADKTSMRNVNTADVINQIIEKFKTGIVKENVSEIKITLKPDYLGDVALKIVSENGIVSAQFTAENQRVKEIIESNFNNLKNMLDEQGVQVSALSVSVGSDNPSERQGFEFEQSKSSKRINSIINGVSEEETEEEKIAEYVDEGDVLQTSVNYTA